MKILFIIPSIAKGGQEKSGMLLCNYLLKYHDVTTVCFEEENSYDFEYRSKIVRLVIPISQSLLGKSLSGFKRIRSLKLLKKELKPDCSIAFGNTAIILNAFTDVGEIKISSIRQSFLKLIANKSISLKIHQFFYVLGLRRSEKIVAVSNDINIELKKYFNINNTYFVNNGFNLQHIGELAAEPAGFYENGKLRIIHSGRFDESKGHWHLIRVFVEIRRKIPNAQLVLLGSADFSTANGNSILEYCKSYISNNKLSWTNEEESAADVIFLGHQKNPFKYLAKSHLFIFPSIWEGFPNALVEAMCCGLPVVSADCPTGPRDILVNNENREKFGLLLPAFDDSFKNTVMSADHNDKYWADQILDLLTNPEKMITYKNLSLKRAADFSINKMGEKWNEIIVKV